MNFNFLEIFSYFKFIFLIFSIIIILLSNKNPLRLAICTMARKENLYIKEYVDYYLKLGFDHIYIFDEMIQMMKIFLMSLINHIMNL